MGCMPYGQFLGETIVFNCPLFQSLIWVACPTGSSGVSITINLHSSFNPSYGLHALRALLVAEQSYDLLAFQSLIWVACPTGNRFGMTSRSRYGFNPSYGLHALRATRIDDKMLLHSSFNPSYGLHALRAKFLGLLSGIMVWVSIPHMGCMPYGLSKISKTY